MNKALVIGVILLFLGVGFQPASAKEIVSITKTSEVEEDCFECQPVNRVELLRVKLLLIRLESITNVILSKFGHIPEIKEKCEDILDVINSNIQWDFPIICSFLSIIWTILYSLALYIESILEKYPDSIIIQYIFTPIGFAVAGLWVSLAFIYIIALECEQLPFIL